MMRISVKILVLMFCLLPLAGCQQDQTVEVGKAAPPLAVFNATGDKVSLARYHGQPVVVEFWSSTCGACLVMMQAWQKYEQQHPQKMAFIGVGIEKPTISLEALAKKLNVSLLLGRDQLGITQERYQVDVTPTTFFIDKQGIVRHIHIGYSNTMDLDHYVNLINQ